MINSTEVLSIWIVLFGYLFSFGVSAIIWMTVDFGKIIKKEKTIAATSFYWLMVLSTTYILAHIIFDFASLITRYF